MLDDMFSFIDPVFDTTEGSLSEFILQIDAFFNEMAEKGKLPADIKFPLSEETYKEMWVLRYQQHLGNITFLELLDRYEEMLGIAKPQDSTGS